MKLQRYTTAEGWPGVRWEQEVPSGWTWFSVLQLVQRVTGLLAGVTVFASLLYGQVSFGWALFWSAAVALAIVAPEAWNRLGAGLEGKGGGGGGTPEAVRETLARWKAEVIYRRESLAAELGLRGKALVLTVGKIGQAQDQRQETPLEKIESFELGTEEEWFGDAAGRELSRLGHAATCWVILAQTTDGTLRVAASGRDKAGIGLLHRVLTSEFLGKRRELNQRAAELTD